MYHSALESTVQGIESPLAQIRACVDKTLDMVAEHKVFMDFFVGEWRPSSNEDEDELARKSMDSYRRIVTFMAERFAEAQTRGEVVDDVEPTYLAIGLLGEIFIFGSYWIYFDPINLSESDKNLIPRIFFDQIALK